MVAERSCPNRVTTLCIKNKKLFIPSPTPQTCLPAHPPFQCQMRKTLAFTSTRLPWRRQSVQRRSDRGSGRRRPEGQRRLRGPREKWRLRGPGEKWRPRRPRETWRLKRPKKWQR